MNNNKLKNELNIILKNIDGNYGILISKRNEIIFEKYIENNKNTRFRIFSCSKLITGLAIILLVQMNLLNLYDTIDKFNINIPNNNKITIIHLLQHSSGVYDFTSKLYFELKPFDMFNNILNKYDTDFIEFNTMINEINKNKPYFKPLTNPYEYHQKNYNNTGYDILGYIIFLVSNIKTNDFIKSYIFDKLNMKQSGFQHEKNKDESTPYDNNKNKAIKEQQNWFCGNAYIVCTLYDYNIFLSNYKKLLNLKYTKIYESLYYFNKIIIDNNIINYIKHEGGGDFNHLHSINIDKYNSISKTIIISFFNSKDNINVIVSENYKKNNGFFTNKYENLNKIINKLSIEIK